MNVEAGDERSWPRCREAQIADPWYKGQGLLRRGLERVRLMKEEDKETLQRYSHEVPGPLGLYRGPCEATQSTATPDSSLETWSSQMPPLPPVQPPVRLSQELSQGTFRVLQNVTAEEAIAAFTRDFVRGRKLPVLALSGHSVDCLVALDKQLRYLVIQRLKKGAKRRALALESVEQVDH